MATKKQPAQAQAEQPVSQEWVLRLLGAGGRDPNDWMPRKTALPVNPTTLDVAKAWKAQFVKMEAAFDRFADGLDATSKRRFARWENLQDELERIATLLLDMLERDPSQADPAVAIVEEVMGG